MYNAILVHGRPSKSDYFNTDYPTESNSHWFPWLSKQLMINGIHTIAIEVPNSYHPIYELWKYEFEKNIINKNTILVGHSCGGGFLIRWLSENKNVKVNKVILVAPWIGYEADDKKEYDESFFDFIWDSELSQRTRDFVIINSSDDMPKIHKSIDTITNNIHNVQTIELIDKGHFTFDSLGTVEFPELRDICLKKQ